MADVTSVTVRNLPQDVHRELAARAARQGQSLQEYLHGELVRLAARPSIGQLVDRIEARKAATGTRIDAATILAARDAERR